MSGARHIAWMSDERNTCRLLVGKPKRKKTIGRLRLRWVYNMKIVLRVGGFD